MNTINFYKKPWFAAILIVGVFVTGLTVGVNALWNNTLGKINTVAKENSVLESQVDGADVKIEEEVLKNPIPYDKDVTNILLLGIDSRDKTKINERSDAMMILTVNKTQKKIKLMSLQRDMLVPIPGMDEMDKLNHANVYGGPELVMKTIEGILRLKIDNYVVVNMRGMEAIVDVVGGVELDITEEAIPFVNENIKYTNKIFKDTTQSDLIEKEGLQHVDGRQAVAYARNRSTAGGDYDRMKYQRDVIQAIYDKFIDIKITEKLKMLNEGLGYITTDLTENEMLGMMESVLPILDGEMETLQIPIEGYHEHYSGEAWLNLCDFNGMIPLVQKFIYGKEFDFDPVPIIPGAPNSSEQPIEEFVNPDLLTGEEYIEEPSYYYEPTEGYTEPYYPEQPYYPEEPTSQTDSPIVPDTPAPTEAPVAPTEAPVAPEPIPEPPVDNSENGNVQP